MMVAAHWLTNLVHGDKSVKSVRCYLPPRNPCSSIGTVWTANQRVKGSKRTKRCKLSTWQIILYLFYLKLHHFLYFCATISLKHNNLKWLTLWLTLTLSFGHHNIGVHIHMPTILNCCNYLSLRLMEYRTTQYFGYGHQDKGKSIYAPWRVGH